jgi:hypothetical protein
MARGVDVIATFTDGGQTEMNPIPLGDVTEFLGFEQYCRILRSLYGFLKPDNLLTGQVWECIIMEYNSTLYARQEMLAEYIEKCVSDSKFSASLINTTV